MPLQLKWVGEDQRDRVAETRGLCYAPARKQVAEYVERLRTDVRSKPGEWLIAERDGVAVGTATSMTMTMWVRGAPVRCQGVAHVGTIKTHRRRGASEPGVGTVVMQETLRAARERGCIVSALMPFRGSWYEHFGYGFVERRGEWTLPMSVLPSGDFEGFRFATDADLDDIVRLKQRVAERGQGDIETSRELWQHYLKQAEGLFAFVDRSGDSIRSYIEVETIHKDTLDITKVTDAIYEDFPALRRVLNFLGSLRDQYSTANITLPGDVRLNWLLAETQMTHRPHRNHPTAECRPFNRMQVRVLDHAKLIEPMKLPPINAGRAVVAIRESEGTTSNISIEVEGGRATVRPSTASPDVECSDVHWAPIVMGDLVASQAANMGLIRVNDPRALSTLAIFAAGPAPYCNEYF